MSIFSSKRSLEKSGIFQCFTDCHCHILPGVDDGIKTMGDSLAVLSYYEELGIREVWLTPHIMEDVPNSPSVLRSRFEELSSAYSGKIVLHLGAENMLDALFRSVSPLTTCSRWAAVAITFWWKHRISTLRFVSASFWKLSWRKVIILFSPIPSVTLICVRTITTVCMVKECPSSSTSPPLPAPTARRQSIKQSGCFPMAMLTVSAATSTVLAP